MRNLNEEEDNQRGVKKEHSSKDSMQTATDKTKIENKTTNLNAASHSKLATILSRPINTRRDLDCLLIQMLSSPKK
jgi:hypothetical protein